MTRKFFYGWRIVIAGGVTQFLQALFLQQAFGAYVSVLVEEKGWSKTALSGAAASQSVEAAILGPILGWLTDKVGARRLIRIGAVVFGCGFLVLSQIDSLPGFYAAIITLAIGSSLCGFFPINVTVIQWFSKYRARALSGVALGLGIGGTCTPIVAWAMDMFGWRTIAMSSAFIVMAILIPMSRVYRQRPEEIGETIDGLPAEPPRRDASGKVHVHEGPEYTLRQALRMPSFWKIAAGHSMALSTVYAVNVHAITHMRTDMGYSLAQAGLIITLMTFFQMIGNGTGVLIGDRFDKAMVAGLCMFLHAAGLLLLGWAGNTAMLIAFAMCHGFAWGLRGPFMNAIRADHFGRNAIGQIMGISALITMLGQIAGPMISGGIADLTGKYEYGFTTVALIVMLGSLTFLTLGKPQPAPPAGC